jgi:Recombination endonuclease VII/Domain of unknown function (DUF5664)
MRCVKCNDDKKIKACGMCARCYERENRSRYLAPGKCAKCQRDILIKRNGYCRSCYNMILPERDPEYSHRTKESKHRYYEANKDRARQATIRRREKRRASQEIRKKEYHRHYELKYGLTSEEVDYVMARGCAICGGRKRLAIDHDHTTGRFRGCLCNACNRGVGVVEKPNSWLELALNYIRNPPRLLNYRIDKVIEAVPELVGLNSFFDVLLFGAKKHPGAPWMQQSPEEHITHALEHLKAWTSGVVKDPESGFSNLAHALTRVAFAVTTEIWEKSFDLS